MTASSRSRSYCALDGAARVLVSRKLSLADQLINPPERRTDASRNNLVDEVPDPHQHEYRRAMASAQELVLQALRASTAAETTQDQRVAAYKVCECDARDRRSQAHWIVTAGMLRHARQTR
jgi:hypothetical protein